MITSIAEELEELEDNNNYNKNNNNNNNNSKNNEIKEEDFSSIDTFVPVLTVTTPNRKTTMTTNPKIKGKGCSNQH